GQAATRVGPPGVAVARVTVTQPGGAPLATVLASTVTAGGYVAQVHRLTGLNLAVIGPGGRVEGTMQVQEDSLPASGHSGDRAHRESYLRVLRLVPGPMCSAGDLRRDGYLCLRRHLRGGRPRRAHR